MNYGERFNYGKIKDDFGYPDHNGYYSSTHTSFDSKFNQISSLDDLQKQYPDKFKTFHDLKIYRWGKGNNFFATYGINKFGEFELLDTNWQHSTAMGDKELKEENERLKEHIILLEEKNDVLEKCNETISKENKENKKFAEESKRKAEAFDKIYKLLYDKFTCEANYQDIYGGSKNGPVKVGQWLEGRMLKQPKLTDKETIKLLNLLLMGMGSDYYVQLNGYIGLDDKDDGKRSL